MCHYKKIFSPLNLTRVQFIVYFIHMEVKQHKNKDKLSSVIKRQSAR